MKRGMTALERKATISDVARLAGVSTATVSRSLSAPSIVSKDARARVAEAVARTGYIANSAAQMLRSRRAGAVLVAVPDLGNTFFSEIIAGVEAVAREQGVAVLVSDVPRGGASGARLAELLDAGRADGALVLHGALLPGAAGAGWKLVTVAEELEPLPTSAGAVSHIGIDNEAAARDATAHLLGLGHRHIAHVTGPPDTILTRQRIAGYRAAMAGVGCEEWLIAGDFSIGSGHAAAAVVLAAPRLPDAVFCANDEMALGLMNALAAAGVSVPGDLSVIGLDDIAFAAYANPPLTTVHQPRAQIGSLAMRELLRQIDGAAPALPVRVAHVLVERGSTARR